MEPDSGAGASDGELGNPDQLTVTWREEREAVGEVEVSVEGEESVVTFCFVNGVSSNTKLGACRGD